MREIYIGRSHEIAEMLSIWNRVLDQTARVPRVILLSGEAGIGKTELINQFILSIQRQQRPGNNMPWIGKGICEIFDEAQVAFLPFYQVLENFRSNMPTQISLTKIEQFNQVVSEIAPSWFKMLPVVGEAIKGTVEGIRELQKKKKEKESFLPSKQPDMDVYAQYLRVIENLPRLANTPLIIVVEDLHWSDQPSLHLLAYLARKLPDSPKPILLLGSFRSFLTANISVQDIREIEVLTLKLQQKKLCHNIKLKPLSEYEVRDYINHSYSVSNSQVHFPQGFQNIIFRKTSGNPLFIRESLRNLEEKGYIASRKSEWKVIDFERAIQEMPETLQAVLEERIGRLEARLKDLLTVASVEGDNFTAQVLSKVKNIEFTIVLDILVQDLSKSLGLVTELAEREIAYRKYLTLYVFKHGLIRDFVYSQLSNAQKRIFHQQVGECLEELYGDKSIDYIALQLARHFWIAKDYPKIIQYGLVAAKQEYAKYAVHQALWWCKNVVGSLQRFPDLPDPITNRYDLLDAYLLQVEALIHLGEHSEAMKVIDTALPIAESDLSYYGRFLYWQGEIMLTWGRYEDALSSTLSSLNIFRKTGLQELQAFALRFLGYIQAVKGGYEDADRYWSEGLSLAKNNDDSYCESLILNDIAVFSNDRGDLSHSEKAAKQALEIYQGTKSKRGETMSLRTLADVEYLRGNLAKAEALIRRATELAQEIDDAVYIVWCTSNLIRCLLARGNYLEAEPLAYQCLERCLEVNDTGFIPDAYIYLCQIELNKKNVENANHYIERAINIVADEDFWTWCHARFVKGEVLISQGQYPEAEVWMQNAYEKATAVGSKLMLGYTSFEYAKSLSLSRKLRDALDKANQAATLFSEMGMRLWLSDSTNLISNINQQLAGHSEDLPPA